LLYHVPQQNTIYRIRMPDVQIVYFNFKHHDVLSFVGGFAP